MALTLTTAQRNTIQLLIDYLRGSGEGPLDNRVSEQLSLIFGGTPGFPCQCGAPSVQDSLRDEPVRTLLRMLLAVAP